MTNTTCLDVAREYIRLKAELTEMTARCNEMRQEIMTYMTRAGKTRVASEEITVVLAHQSRSQLDTKALRADHPDIVRNYEYVTEYDELKIL
jgi:predicted phage-related endonuclease